MRTLSAPRWLPVRARTRTGPLASGRYASLTFTKRAAPRGRSGSAVASPLPSWSRNHAPAGRWRHRRTL